MIQGWKFNVRNFEGDFEDGYSDAERRNYKPFVYATTVSSMIEILKVMKDFGITFSEADCDEHDVKLRTESAQKDNIDPASDVAEIENIVEKYWRPKRLW